MASSSSLAATLGPADFNVLGTGNLPAPAYKYPDNVGQAPFDKWIFFEARSGRHVVRDQVVTEAGGTDRTLASVALYLSETALKNSLSVAYEETAMGPFKGAIAELLAQGGQNLMHNVMTPGTDFGLKQGLKDIRSFVGKVGETLTKEYRDMIGLTLHDGVSSLTSPAFASTVLGQKPNPRTDVLFDTAKYRSYEMSFLLVPRTLSEAVAIDNIIRFFQFYMLPMYVNPGTQGSAGSFMIGFPYEFEITCRDAFGEMEHVNKFERCVITDITIDHAAGGKTAFVKTDAGLYPVATSLTLGIQEVRLLDRNSDAIVRKPTDGFVGPSLSAQILPDPRQ